MRSEFRVPKGRKELAKIDLSISWDLSLDPTHNHCKPWNNSISPVAIIIPLLQVGYLVGAVLQYLPPVLLFTCTVWLFFACMFSFQKANMPCGIWFIDFPEVTTVTAQQARPCLMIPWLPFVAPCMKSSQKTWRMPRPYVMQEELRSLLASPRVKETSMFHNPSLAY